MNMYFIAIICPDEINERVNRWKRWMKDKFGCVVALRSPAHITLVPPFWMEPAIEGDLYKTINGFASGYHEFSIRLNGFSFFKPGVIFVSVEADSLLLELQNQLINYLLKDSRYPIKADDRPFHPHVTIATRDLHKKSFYEAWEHFNRLEYKVEWTATGISLLRHNKKNWDVVTTSQFK